MRTGDFFKCHPIRPRWGHPAEYAPANQGLGLRVCLLCPMRSAEIQLPCIQARKRTGHARHRVHRNRCATRRLMKTCRNEAQHKMPCGAMPACSGWRSIQDFDRGVGTWHHLLVRPSLQSVCISPRSGHTTWLDRRAAHRVNPQRPASDAVLHGHVPMAHVVRARLERSLIKTTLSWGVQDG